MEARAPTQHWRGRQWLVVGVLVILVPGLLTEALLRLFVSKRYELYQDERSVSYRHDPELGWFPIAGSTKQYKASRTISIRNNSHGFRDHEYGPKERPRVAVVGDSFVWGFDVEQSERLTEALQKLWPTWEVMNLGVSGYGTDQEYLLLQRWFDRLQPDVVLLVFSGDNDRDDNITNSRYGYFKPFFRKAGGSLNLSGVPVFRELPHLATQHELLFKSLLVRGLARAILRFGRPARTIVPDPTHELVALMRDFVEARGARFAVGVQGDDTALVRFLEGNRIRSLLLNTRERYPDYFHHWTPAGHSEVARAVFDLLMAEGLAPRAPHLATTAADP